jgi:lysophospholipase L1-like esterase
MSSCPATLLCIGDSVTDCGRARPVGTRESGLGDGWVALVQQGLDQRGAAVRLLNLGVGGDTVRHLAARWQRDVLDLRPDTLVVGVGINDVWRRFDTPQDPAAHVPCEEFSATYDRLLRGLRPRPRLLLLTPFFIQPQRADPMRRMMDEYGAAVRELAARHGAASLDLQALFDEACLTQPAERLAGDRIHTTAAGHALLARAVLDALEALEPWAPREAAGA